MRLRTSSSNLAASMAAAVLATLPFAAGAADPYEINVIAPITGPVAFLGKEEVSGLTVLEDTVNKAGGVRGRAIKFVVQDDQSNPQIAVQLTNAIVAKNVPVILGTASSASCNAMLPLAANGPVIYCFSPGIHPPAGSYVFSSGASSTDNILASVRYLREQGLRRIGVINATDASGQDAERGIDAAIAAPENKGTMIVVDREHFNPTDLSVAAQIARIKSSGAQAAIMWTTGTAFGTVLRDAVQGGLTVPLVTTAGNMNFAQLESYASFMPDNLYMTGPAWADPSKVPNAGVRSNVAAYLAAFKAAGIRPDEGQSIAWDPALLVIEGLKRYGTAMTATQLREYLSGVHGWTGVNGVYDFRAIPQRGIGIDWLIMLRWDKTKDGLVAVSKPGGLPL